MKSHFVLILLIFLIAIQSAPLHATSLDELEHPLLDEGQILIAPSYDIRYSSYDFEFWQFFYTGTVRRVEFEYGWHYWKHTFGLDILYGLNELTQVKLNTKYSLDYDYNFSYTKVSSNVATPNYDWEETEVKYRLPFYVDGGLKIRPIEWFETNFNYKYERYNTDTHIKYGLNLYDIDTDHTETSNSQLHEAIVGLTLLSDPYDKNEALRSDLDGRLHPLLEQNQVMLKSDCIFKFEELGFRYYKENHLDADILSQEKFDNISFSNELAVGLTDSLQASANFNYYLPYTYVEKFYLYQGRSRTNELYQDLTQKYHNTYEIAGTLNKRFEENLEVSIDGLFRKWKYRESTNRYRPGTGSSAASYPIASDYRIEAGTLKAGGTYLSDAKKDRGELEPNLDGLLHPLLEKNQFMTSAFLKYDLRFRDFRTFAKPAPQRARYTKNQFSIIGGFAYGLSDKLEYNANITYEFPYQYVETRYDNDDDSFIAIYTYEAPSKLYINSEIVFRPTQNMEFSINGGYMPRGDIPYQLEVPLEVIYSDREIHVDHRDSGNFHRRVFEFDTYYLTAKFRYLF